MDSPSAPLPHASPRPYWLILIVALAAAANLIGLAGRLASLPRDAGVPLSASPWLGIIYTGLWSAVFAGLALALVRRAWARTAALWAAGLLTLYALTGLVMLAVFARADYDRGRIGAELAGSTLVLAAVWRVALRRARLAAHTEQRAA